MKAAFHWDDAFRFDEQLTDDERAVRDAARAYCQDRLQPRVLMAARHATFDREIMNEIGALGMLGSTIDGYGCPGVNRVSYGLVAREVERVDEDRGQDEPARIDRRRDRDGRRVRAGREPAAARHRLEGSLRLPQQGTLRHRVGRTRCGRVLLARRAPVHARPQAVRPAPRGNQLVQRRLADMQTEITLGLQGCLRVGRLR